MTTKSIFFLQYKIIPFPQNRDQQEIERRMRIKKEEKQMEGKIFFIDQNAQ